MSQNFVRLNMKIRRYKRKGQSSTSKFKRHRFGKKDTCYKCGGKGHWARDCPTSKNLGTFDGEEVLYCEDQGERTGEDGDCTVQEETMETTCDVGGVDSKAVTKEKQVEKASAPVLAEGTASVSELVPKPLATGRKSVKRTVLSSVSTERKSRRAGGRKAKRKVDRASEDPACDQPSSVAATWDLPADPMGTGEGQSQATDPVGREEGELHPFCTVYSVSDQVSLLSSSD